MPAKNRRRNNTQFQAPDSSSEQSSSSSFGEQALVVAERTGSSSLSNTQYPNNNASFNHYRHSQPGYHNTSSRNATSNVTPQSFDMNLPAGSMIRLSAPLAVSGTVSIPEAQQQPQPSSAQATQHGNSWFTTGSSTGNRNQITNNGGGQSSGSSTCQACGANLNGCGHGNQDNTWAYSPGNISGERVTSTQSARGSAASCQ
ncbi:hypothetical protein V8F33_012353 [Rhypophila sp. PSN 637]